MVRIRPSVSDGVVEALLGETGLGCAREFPAGGGAVAGRVCVLLTLRHETGGARPRRASLRLPRLCRCPPWRSAGARDDPWRESVLGFVNGIDASRGDCELNDHRF